MMLTKEKIIGIIFMKLATHITTYRRRVELWQIGVERRQGCRRWWRRRGAKVGTWACSFSPRNQDVIFELGLLLRRRPFGAGGTGGSAPSASLFPPSFIPVASRGAVLDTEKERRWNVLPTGEAKVLFGLCLTFKTHTNSLGIWYYNK